jgi:diguanylate cyclase (GGDEF)-like protein/PAS domain S-box-containing protein
LKILIADDECISRSMLEELLKDWGHEVIAVGDGLAAWQVLQGADAPRLAILDWSMPGLEGVDVCAKLRAVPTSQPPYVLIVTTKGGKQNVVVALQAGANDHLTKPFDPDELRARVNVGIGMIELQQRLAQQVRDLGVALAHLRESEEMFRQLTENIQEVFWMTDPAIATMLYVSPAYEKVWGRTCESLFRNPKSFLDAVHPEEREGLGGAFLGAMRAGKPFTNEYRITRPDGDVRWVRARGFPVCNQKGEAYRYAGIAEDITARKDAEARIEILAFHDALTGLPNRVEFHNRLVQAIARAKRAEMPVALYFIDLDQFKVVNDTLGHALGDALLVAVAQRLQSCVRASDTVARIGGDEFAILQTDPFNAQGAAELARKVLRVMSAPFRLADRDVHTSPSIGVTLFPVDSDDPNRLMQNADMAMYHAKQEGRNNFQFFTADLNAEVRKQMVLEADLRRAVEHEEFVLHYQPQMDLRTGRLVGMEALIRWQHPNRGLLLPGTFIALAEATGLIHPITQWVLKQACTQNAAWQAAGLPCCPVAVNISPASFKRSDLCRNIAEVLEQTGLPPKFLQLEVTESILLQDEQITTVVPELERMGIELAIDDFGTGYSSLNYLHRLPVCKLKIDQSFVLRIPGSPDDAIIAQAIIDLGHALGRTVIAEGVETEAQFTFLREKGCDEGQGYHFNKPLAAEAFEAFLRTQKPLTSKKLKRAAERPHADGKDPGLRASAVPRASDLPAVGPTKRFNIAHRPASRGKV